MAPQTKKANRIVIAGAGPAGVTVAETVRAFDRQTELVVISAEPYAPYSPPAMVDHFLTGSQLHFWRGQDWAEKTGVTYLWGVEVTAVEPENHRVQLAHSQGAAQPLEYDKLVIAAGGRLYAPIPGADLPGVYNFKSLSAAEALVKRVRAGEANRAVIVGAGFIGVEIALLLSELGVRVTQIEMVDQVMPKMLDSQSAEFVLRILQRKGVEVRLETKAAAFTGEGRAEAVLLESGELIPADILVAATGIRPNVELVQSSGLQHGWGMRVDSHLRTSDEDVYAAGDIVEAPDRMTGEAYVHAIFPNAIDQGRVVGLNLAGFDVEYEGARSMNSLKHLGLPVMVAGLKTGSEMLQETSPGCVRTLYLQDNRLVGFQLAGDVRNAGAFQSLIDSRQDLGTIKHNLLDPAFGQAALVWRAIVPTTR